MELISAVGQGVGATLLLTVAGFLIGAVGGIPLLLLRISPIAPVRFVGRAIIEILRGVPPIVWLFMIFNGLPSLAPGLTSTFTPMRSAILGLGLISCSYMAEIYRGCLTAIKQGQWEASHALGMSTFDTAARVIGPQVMRIAVPAAATYAIGLLKDSSIAYSIGATELMWHAYNQMQISSDAMTPYLVAGAFYILLTVPTAYLARTVDARLRRRVAR
ncbi:amino acid ABC transporter permease [Actinomycetota bacterium]